MILIFRNTEVILPYSFVMMAWPVFLRHQDPLIASETNNFVTLYSKKHIFPAIYDTCLLIASSIASQRIQDPRKLFAIVTITRTPSSLQEYRLQTCENAFVKVNFIRCVHCCILGIIQIVLTQNLQQYNYFFFQFMVNSNPEDTVVN